MATEADIGGNGDLFVGEDKTLKLVLPAIDMTGWAVKFDVRKADTSLLADVIFTKTASITGTYSATLASNTQRAVVSLTDTEMLTVTNRTYRYSYKRIDDNSETILARGNFIVEKATQHE